MAQLASNVAKRADAIWEDRSLPRVGEVIGGKYRLKSIIGAGAMGVVMAADHVVLGHSVALKFMHPHLVDNQIAVTRFAREARAAARLRSEHTVRIFDVEHLPWGAPFIVMEHLEGRSLDEIGPVPIDDAVSWMLQACDALAEAHDAGIIHRDIKPENLYLARGKNGRVLVKVLDFGLAKCLDGEGHAGSTATSNAIGSPQYMPPEQVMCAPIDARADIWSIGATLYELLTGHPPFTAPNVTLLFAAILHATPEAARVLRPDLPPALEAVVMRCLSRDPAARFGSARELARALNAAVGRQRPTARDRLDDTGRRQSRTGPSAPPPALVSTLPSHVTLPTPVRRSSGAALAALVGPGLIAAAAAVCAVMMLDRSPPSVARVATAAPSRTPSTFKQSARTIASTPRPLHHAAAIEAYARRAR